MLDLAADERVAGLRLDHIDGLADPATFLRRLRHDLDRSGAGATLLVEKIVARDEQPPDHWPIEGTTGYEFADVAGGLFVDPAGADALWRAGADLTGDARPFETMGVDARREVLDHLFPGQAARLGRLVGQALDHTRPGHDLTEPEIAAGVAALLVHLDVYRTYLEDREAVAAGGRRLARAARSARAGLDDGGRRAMAALVDGLVPGDGDTAGDDVWAPVRQRFEQLSGAVMAKGVEDTATYRFPGLLAHAEVGQATGSPARTPAEFARAVTRRARQAPSGLNATSTHDSKRSEDVRARLWTLSEAPDEWLAAVGRWRRRFAGWVLEHGGPDPLDELRCYQTLFGVWPFAGAPGPELARRVRAALEKSAREAKLRTSWLDPDPAYERALRGFVGQVLATPTFVAEMSRLVQRLGAAGAANSLAQLVLKSVCPGVPDFYQGTELWDFSLVDPDNRRPVDFDGARRLLDALPAPPTLGASGTAELAELAAHWPDGRLKLHVTRTLLGLRREATDVMARGGFRLLETTGSHAERLVAVARRSGARWVVAVVTRQTLSLAGPGRLPSGDLDWGDTAVLLRASTPDRSGSAAAVGRWRSTVGASVPATPSGCSRWPCSPPDPPPAANGPASRPPRRHRPRPPPGPPPRADRIRPRRRSRGAGGRTCRPAATRPRRR